MVALESGSYAMGLETVRNAGYDHVELAYVVGGRAYETAAANRFEVRPSCGADR